MTNTTTYTTPLTANKKFVPSNFFVFCLFWVLLFILYLPAAKAGMVGDFPGWLDELKTSGFMDYLNRVHSKIHSLYQFKQICTYALYRIFKTNPWPWHLVHITLHATVCMTLFILFRRLFYDSNIKGAETISFCGVLLYCISPYNSEVIVWEPAFHYLQAFTLMLLILLSVQKYYRAQRSIHVWIAGILFILSTYTLEVFYITPLLTFTLAIYYRMATGYNKLLFKKIVLYFIFPQILIFTAHIIVLHAYYGPGLARLGDDVLRSPFYLFQKPSKYLYHILAFGRFFPNDVRHKVYEVCDSKAVIIITISIILIACAYILFQFREMGNNGKIISFLFIWLLLNLCMILPMQFPDMLLVIYDRYTYFLSAFIFILFSALLYRYLRKALFLFVIGVYVIGSFYIAFKISNYWGRSANIISNLLETFPNPADKTVIMLSLPKCYKGIQMINAEQEGQFKRLHNLLLTKQVSNTIYDGLGFNMESVTDGTHVTVINDSTVRVTLNQWGTWWWYGDLGAINYSNDDYSVDLKDPGHMYELVLKKPASTFLLLYQVGANWHIVDWNKKNIDQY